MERYNIFLLIHKGLRASLYHTALQLQQTDFIADDEAENAVNRVKEIVMLFNEHAHKEDSFILPLVHQYEPSVAASFEDEHVKDEELGSQLQAGVEKLAEASTLLEKLIAGRKLMETFESFLVFNLQHMAKEEEILNSILWRYFSDEEIVAISNKITLSVAPWMQDFYATWMLRGINNTEAGNWMKAVEKGAPAIVFQSLLQKAEKEFSQQRLHKITRSLSEGVLVA